MFKAAANVLQEAVNSSVVEVAIEGTRAVSAFLRLDVVTKSDGIQSVEFTSGKSKCKFSLKITCK